MIKDKRDSILVVEKIDNAALNVDMVVAENDDDKNLVAVKIVQGNDKYKTGDVIVTGKYSIYKLVYRGNDYFFMEDADYIATLEE